jgi:hypothetical protein
VVAIPPVRDVMRRWRNALAIGLVLAGPAVAEEQKQSKMVQIPFGGASVPFTRTADTITLDGGITINTITGEVTIPKGMSPSEAARRFWNAVAVVKGAPPPWPGSMPRP